MKEYAGTILSPGTGFGPVRAVFHEKRETDRKREDKKGEEARFFEAVEKSKAELSELFAEAEKSVGKEAAEIFAAQQVILSDEEWIGLVLQKIREENMDAESAVSDFAGQYEKMVREAGEDADNLRADDLFDVSHRVLDNLDGENSEKEEGPDSAPAVPYVLVTDHLSPSEAVGLSKEQVAAVVTVDGSSFSHTAILLSGMQIPALAAVPVSASLFLKDHTAFVDANRGVLILDPEKDAALNVTKPEKASGLSENAPELFSLPIPIAANISSPSEAEEAKKAGAGGIGLFRTEYLYLSGTMPTEEEQFLAYQKVVQTMGDAPVVIRAADIGADKKVSSAGSREVNPALGLRGIRFLLANPDLFRVQIRAVLRASSCGNVKFLLPMITSVDELLSARSLMQEEAETLSGQGISCSMPQTGVMIETPAAALTSDLLAEEADFFSIGTNDLTQYTLAADREDGSLHSVYNPHHRAVFDLISLTVRNAHKKGKTVSVCGESAADETLTERWINIGVDELSVNVPNIASLRKKEKSLIS